MKKISILAVLCLAVCLLLTGCGNNTDSKKNSSEGGTSADASTADLSSSEPPSANEGAAEKPKSGKQSGKNHSSDDSNDDTSNDTSNDTNDNTGDDTNDDADGESHTVALKEPTLDWWEISDSDENNTLTAALTNLNKEAIDVSYDVVYYKGDKEVARNEYFTNIGVMPGKQDVIYSNYNIPKSADVEKIKLENIKVSKTTHPPINGKYEHVGKEEGKELFDFTFDKKPTLATITFLLYNDKNKNKQFDKGEIVTTFVTSLTEQTGRVYFEPAGRDYTDYQVFFNAT